MKKSFFTAFFLFTFYGISNAQTVKFVNLPNGALVPCDHPLAISAGLNCSNPIPVTATPLTPSDRSEPFSCVGDINPYSEPDRAAYCAARSIPIPDKVVNNYQIGEKYAHAYASNRMVVIGLARDLFNRTVVTYQWYAGQHVGVVGSFIVGVTETPFRRIED